MVICRLGAKQHWHSNACQPVLHHWHACSRTSASALITYGNWHSLFSGVFGRFDLAALCGCHTLKVCYVMFFRSMHWEHYEEADIWQYICC